MGTPASDTPLRRISVIASSAVFAACLALLTAALLGLGGADYLLPFLQRDIAGALLAAWFILLFIPLLVIRAASSGQGLSYGALWTATLELTVICGAGLVFTLLSWIGLLLAVELLRQVGLPFDPRLFRTELLPIAVSALLMGIGVAVSAHWPLNRASEVLAKLLRLMAPPFFCAMLAFAVALLVNGFATPHGMSAQLMGVAVIGSAMLISCIAGKDGLVQSAGRFWQAIAAGLTVLMLPAAIAQFWPADQGVAALALRPEGITQVALSVFALLLAVGYVGTLLSRRSLAALNCAAGGALLLWALALLTGILSPEAIAVRQQIARLERGEAGLQELPLRQMSLYWGAAGEAGIDKLQLKFAQDPDALEMLARMSSASSPPISMTPPSPTVIDPLLELQNKLVMLPESPISAADFVLSWDVPAEARRSLMAACAVKTPAGHAGCLAVAGDFLPMEDGDEIILFSLEAGAGDGGRATGWQRQGTDLRWRKRELIGDFYLLDAAAAIDQLHQSGAVLRPLPIQSLMLDDQDIFFRPTLRTKD